MDAAYDAQPIRTLCHDLGIVSLIDSNPRGQEKIPLDPAKAERYKSRSSVERVNSLLKEGFGGRHVRVRGPEKVFAHLMFGIVALTATQLLRLRIRPLQAGRDVPMEGERADLSSRNLQKAIWV